MVSSQRAVKNNRVFSLGFLVSLALSITAASFLALTIALIPTDMPNIFVGIGTPFLDYDTFFYDVSYIGFFFDLPQDYVYELNTVSPSTGFFLFVSLAMILFAISSTTMLVKDFMETKLLIFSNWLLYLVPIIVGIIKIYQAKDLSFYGGLNIPRGVFPYTLPLASFPFFYLFLHFALLLDKNSFKVWTGFFRKDYHSALPTVYLIPRRINAGIFLYLLFSVSGLVLPIMIGTYFGSGILNLFSCLVHPIIFVLFSLIELFGKRIAQDNRLLLEPTLPADIFYKDFVSKAFPSTKKRLVFEQLANKEYNLQTITIKTSLPLIEVTKLISSAITTKKLHGNLSPDGLTFIPT